MNRRAWAGMGVAYLALSGCHSHYIQTTITNATKASVNVVQVDYPHASFGTQQLAPGESFHYRFKLLGSGPIRISYIDAYNGQHEITGPSLKEGQEGQLEIVVDAQNHASFHTSIKP